MAMYKAFSSIVEVNGETVLSIVNGVGLFKKQALEILKTNGIENPEPGKWYSQQAWLNSFKTIGEKIGEKTLFNIGKSIPENAKFPPDVNSIEKALSSIDIAYHMNHKNGEIGHYKFELTGSNSGKFTCNNPYSCDFDMGIISSMGRKFLPPSSIGMTIEHESDNICRKKGKEECIFIVKW